VLHSHPVQDGAEQKRESVHPGCDDKDRRDEQRRLIARVEVPQHGHVDQAVADVGKYAAGQELADGCGVGSCHGKASLSEIGWIKRIIS